jgi:hypothetical protein
MGVGDFMGVGFVVNSSFSWTPTYFLSLALALVFNQLCPAVRTLTVAMSNCRGNSELLAGIGIDSDSEDCIVLFVKLWFLGDDHIKYLVKFNALNLRKTLNRVAND